MGCACSFKSIHAGLQLLVRHVFCLRYLIITHKNLNKMIDDKNKEPIDSQDMDAEITPEERSLLDVSIENGLMSDNEAIRKSALDNTDDDGELLNVESLSDNITGEDLDIPGAELDDENEMIGEEDEENNGYSQADTE